MRRLSQELRIDTVLRQAVPSVLHRQYGADTFSSDPRKACAEVRKTVRNVVAAKMVLFGSAGQLSS